MSEAKEIIFETEAREKLATGIGKLAQAVRATLGPKGRNVALEKGWGAPTITNDGHSIVKDIELPDQFENMGVSIAKEVASKLKDICGDGTTTGTLLLDSLVQYGLKGITAGCSPISIKRGIDKTVTAIVKELEKMSIEVKSFQETKNIATVSASGNEEIGEFIAQALEKVGRQGVVTIEESKSMDTSIELVEGMRLDRGYMSPYFVSDQEKMIAEMEQPYILITDKKVSSIQEMIPLLQAVAATGKELLIVADDLEADVLATLVVNKIRGTLKTVAIKAPGFGDRRKAMLEDIAALTGATVISEEVGIALKDASIGHLGSCDRIIVTKETSTLIGGSSEHEEKIQGRIRQIEIEYQQSTSSYDKEKLLERKAKLKGGIAVIRVGAATEPELKQRKQMFEDSLNATQAALEEGVVVGAGVALLRASLAINLSLEGDEAYGLDIVKKAAETPARQIIQNTGCESSVIITEIKGAASSVGFNARTEKVEDLLTAGVIDPVKVVKNCLIHAASAAGMTLISEALIGSVEETDEEK